MAARKYRQRGYQDDEPRERRVGRGPRTERLGPGGRGLGAPTATVFKCARCGEHAELATELAADTTCGRCGSDLRTCTNCRHFDTGAPNECRVEIETRIAAKSKRNECERFSPRAVQEFAEQASESDAKAAFDSLFDF